MTVFLHPILLIPSTCKLIIYLAFAEKIILCFVVYLICKQLFDGLSTSYIYSVKFLSTNLYLALVEKFKDVLLNSKTVYNFTVVVSNILQQFKIYSKPSRYSSKYWPLFNVHVYVCVLKTPIEWALNWTSSNWNFASTVQSEFCDDCMQRKRW